MVVNTEWLAEVYLLEEKSKESCAKRCSYYFIVAFVSRKSSCTRKMSE